MITVTKISISLPISSPETVDENFSFEVEVYCSLPADDGSGKVSTPIKMLKRLRHKVQRHLHTCVIHLREHWCSTQDKGEDVTDQLGTPLQFPSSPYTPRGPAVSPSHRFALAGHAHLSIKDIAGTCRYSIGTSILFLKSLWIFKNKSGLTS